VIIKINVEVERSEGDEISEDDFVLARNRLRKKFKKRAERMLLAMEIQLNKILDELEDEGSSFTIDTGDK
jgi:hypothetical protein